jgi:hypothetical protein
MTKLVRLSNWILPWLIYLDPIVATAYYKAVAEDEAPAQTLDARRVFWVRRDLPLPTVGVGPAATPEFSFPQPA